MNFVFFLTILFCLRLASGLDVSRGRSSEGDNDRPTFGSNQEQCDSCKHFIEKAKDTLSKPGLKEDEVEPTLEKACESFPGSAQDKTYCTVVAYEYSDEIYASIVASVPVDPSKTCFITKLCDNRKFHFGQHH